MNTPRKFTITQTPFLCVSKSSRFNKPAFFLLKKNKKQKKNLLQNKHPLLTLVCCGFGNTVSGQYEGQQAATFWPGQSCSSSLKMSPKVRSLRRGWGWGFFRGFEKDFLKSDCDRASICRSPEDMPKRSWSWAIAISLLSSIALAWQPLSAATTWWNGSLGNNDRLESKRSVESAAGSMAVEKGALPAPAALMAANSFGWDCKSPPTSSQRTRLVESRFMEVGSVCDISKRPKGDSAGNACATV